VLSDEGRKLATRMTWDIEWRDCSLWRACGSDCMSLCTVPALRFVYYLDEKKAALISISDDVGILAYEKANGNHYHLDGQYLSPCFDDLRY
jgi:hypothetical protein